MSADFDFSSLYRELRLTPSASLPDMKLAYRRRVAELHPDRIHNDGEAALAASELQRLTRLYNDAMDFERRYGRLPGAPAATRFRTSMQRPHAAAPGPQRRFPWMWLLIGIGLICAILLLVDATVDEPSGTAVEPVPAETTQAMPASGLRLGMPRRIVRLVQGEPYLDGGDRWEYGPSWLLFNRDLLVDWYSSPLNPLKVAHSRPTGRDETDLRMARQRGTAERTP